MLAGLADADDRRTLLAVASAFWRDRLSPEERKEFREKAQGEPVQEHLTRFNVRVKDGVQYVSARTVYALAAKWDPASPTWDP